ncbi:unnamed protein product [Phyllotreta striolata]|uniref:Uncharacterized protein n=1 Tax=Phyllotreta striolata TaxID=444603 RepID=A0A9N9U1E8_PHYSR|nr:unnamed protein product [Phyllotreta striolata]
MKSLMAFVVIMVSIALATSIALPSPVPVPAPKPDPRAQPSGLYAGFPGYYGYSASYWNPWYWPSYWW